MAPGAHLLLSWLGTVQVIRNSRERALVTFSGIAADIVVSCFCFITQSTIIGSGLRFFDCEPAYRL